MRSEPAYNPLDKKNLGSSVADALLARPLVPLPPEEVFSGAGVYAIYYAGTFPAYAPISLTRRGQQEIPIYVGKAVPKGSRKGGFGVEDTPGPVLHGRLRQHADSITQCENLDLSDFSCRFLVVDDIWIPLGEALLIQAFSPVWNRVIDGFGNHNPGKGRHEGQMPPWDVVHPGREWATRLRPHKKSAAELLEEVKLFFSNQPQA